MFDIINGFVGIGFAWLVLGFILLPLAKLIEHWLGKYVAYATDNEVKIPEKLGACEKLNLWAWEFPTTLGLLWGMFILFGVGIAAAYGCDKLALSSMDLVIFAFFGAWAHVGTHIAPILLLIAAISAPTFVSRKMFKLKKKFEEHVASKNAHKGEE